MVVGEMSGYSFSPAFHIGKGSKSESAPPARRNGSGVGGMKSFVSGMMSPLTACWAPDPASCVPGCSTDYHSRPRYTTGHPPSTSPHSPAVVSPLMDRINPPKYDIPVSPVASRYQPKLGRRSDQPEVDKALPTQDIEKPHANDVLCGRGGSSNRHVGNMHFRELVAGNKKMYVGLTKKQKMLVARKIVDLVRSTDPPGRFLSKDLDTGLWYDIGLPRSLEKTSQALREKNSNEYPTDQGTEVSDVLSDVSMPCSARSDSGVASPVSTEEDKQSNKINRSSKHVEAPPLIIPPHLLEVFSPKKAQESEHVWPEFSPSSRSHLEQPYLNPYPPASPGQDHYAVPPRSLHYDVPPRSPPRYYPGPGHYAHSEQHPPYGHPESPPPQDYRDYYDYYPRGPDPRDHYGQTPPPRAPPPPHGHYRSYPPPPPPPGPPPRPHRHHRHPPHRPSPMHHHASPSKPYPLAATSSPHPMTPTPYDQGYSHPHHAYGQPHAARDPSARSPHVPPPASPQTSASPSRVSNQDKYLKSPGANSNGYIRSNSEISPERRQEWKRQRNERGATRRLSSDCSLSKAVEKSLTLEERVVGRERASSIATAKASNVGDREFTENTSRELTSPSGAIQGRSRPRTDGKGKVAVTSAASLSEKEGDAISALSGLAALSTAAFLKLDEANTKKPTQRNT